MHDVTAGEHFESFHYLSEISQRSFLGEGALLLHQLIESAAVAVLVHEIEIVGCFEHVDVFDDMGAALQRGQDVDLVDRALLQLGDLFELFGLDHLDGDFLLRDQVNRLVDLRVDALAQLLLQFVVLNYLPHGLPILNYY